MPPDVEAYARAVRGRALATKCRGGYTEALAAPTTPVNIPTRGWYFEYAANTDWAEVWPRWVASDRGPGGNSPTGGVNFFDGSIRLENRAAKGQGWIDPGNVLDVIPLSDIRRINDINEGIPSQAGIRTSSGVATFWCPPWDGKVFAFRSMRMATAIRSNLRALSAEQLFSSIPTADSRGRNLTGGTYTLNLVLPPRSSSSSTPLFDAQTFDGNTLWPVDGVRRSASSNFTYRLKAYRPGVADPVAEIRFSGSSAAPQGRTFISQTLSADTNIADQRDRSVVITPLPPHAPYVRYTRRRFNRFTSPEDLNNEGFFPRVSENSGFYIVQFGVHTDYDYVTPLPPNTPVSGFSLQIEQSAAPTEGAETRFDFYARLDSGAEGELQQALQGLITETQTQTLQATVRYDSRFRIGEYINIPGDFEVYNFRIQAIENMGRQKWQKLTLELTLRV